MLVAAAVAVSLVACGGGGDDNTDASDLEALLDQVSEALIETQTAFCLCDPDRDDRADCLQSAARSQLPPCIRDVFREFENDDVRRMLACVLPASRESTRCFGQPNCTRAVADACVNRFEETRDACMVAFPFPAGFEDALDSACSNNSDGRVNASRRLYLRPQSGGLCLVTNPSFYAEEIGIVVTYDGTIPCATSVLRISSPKAGKDWDTPEMAGTRAFVPADRPFLVHARKATIMWELVYGGRSGTEIAMTYREYYAGRRGTFARPAFYQELKYDLAGSERVVFRAIEMEILEASNSGVKFRVLRDAQRPLGAP